MADSKMKKFLTDSGYRFRILGARGFYKRMSDEKYLKKLFKIKTGKELDLENPQTFNEKLQWLKLHDRNPEYTKMVDKYEVKQYVADRIGEEYIIPTLGVWDKFADIDFDSLPDQFVLKCTHDSGGVVICRDKKDFDVKAARKTLNKHLRRNFYWSGREWPYKDVQPRIIAEKYMEDESGYELKDYKAHNFDGEPKIIQVDFNRFSDHMKNLYNANWEYIEAAMNYPTDPTHYIARPESLERMLEIAAKLSAGIPYLRTDFYSIENKIYFGELTFSPGSGYMSFNPEEFGMELGSWIKLPGGGYLIASEGFVLYGHVTRKTPELIDYKFYCFDGEPKYLYVSQGLENHETAHISFLTLTWEFAPFGRSDYEPFEELPEKPECYEEMLELVKTLSVGHAFLRVDLYVINQRIYVSEFTFTPCGGMMPFVPEEWDGEMGELLKLPGTDN